MKKFPEVPEINLNVKGTLNSFHHTDKWIQTLLMAVGEHFGLKVFVETGTQAGNTVAAVHEAFDAVYSIEVFEAFYIRAQAIFADVPNVHLILGSSEKVLADVLKKEGITRALFWLDAHGEGLLTAVQPMYLQQGNQLYKELQAIEQQAPDSLVVIDDVFQKVSNGYMVNLVYPFVVPAGWKEVYIHHMSLLVLHRGGYSMPEGLQF
jgi:hypothetical protein